MALMRLELMPCRGTRPGTMAVDLRPKAPSPFLLYMFQFQVLPVRGYPPPQWYGLTMEGRAHTQCYVGNSFMSRLCLQPSVQNAPFHRGGG